MTNTAAKVTLFWVVTVTGAVVAFQLIPRNTPTLLVFGLTVSLAFGVLMFVRRKLRPPSSPSSQAASRRRSGRWEETSIPGGDVPFSTNHREPFRESDRSFRGLAVSPSPDQRSAFVASAGLPAVYAWAARANRGPLREG